LAGLYEAIFAKDWNAVEFFVHRLSGTSNFYATGNISNLLDHIRNINNDTENTDDLFNELNQEYQIVLDEIRQRIARHST
jgi:hypothetical protein